eukprot:COSAG02_NODE_182_length_30594_cov_23.562912_20_plen_55_part_00
MFFAILHSINVCKCTQKNIVWALDLGRFQSSVHAPVIFHNCSRDELPSCAQVAV